MSVGTELIEYEDGGKTLEGYFACREALPFPLGAVLVCHAWGGRGDFECEKARDLAELGYAAFAVDLYGKGVLGDGPETNQRLMQPFIQDRGMLRRRLGKALDTVRGIDRVDKARVAAIGYCFGGLCVLDMARAGAALNPHFQFDV